MNSKELLQVAKNLGIDIKGQEKNLLDFLKITELRSLTLKQVIFFIINVLINDLGCNYL